MGSDHKDDWGGRRRQHDDFALPMVLAVWEKQGFDAHKAGTETDVDALRKSLRAQNDPASRMMRFRPDQVLVKHGAGSILCEVKSEGRGYHNFAVETDSWLATQSWEKAIGRVCYAFADLKRDTVLACWSGDLPRPGRVRVPTRFDWLETMARLAEEIPWAYLEPVEHQGGSGTAHFLVAKCADFLRPLDTFIRSEVLKVAHLGTPVAGSCPEQSHPQGHAPQAVPTYASPVQLEFDLGPDAEDRRADVRRTFGLSSQGWRSR